MFWKCFDGISDAKNALKRVLKIKYFNILNGIDGCWDAPKHKAWEGAISRTTNSAWNNLWTEYVHEKNFEEFDPSPIIPTYVQMQTTVD